MIRRVGRHGGFTLVELMIVVAVIAIISAVALPIYNDYVRTAREGKLITNISTIEVFQEDVRLRTGNYVAGAYDVGGGDTSLADPPLGWNPQTDDGTVYQVVLGGGGYEVTATDPDGTSVCRSFPGKNPC